LPWHSANVITHDPDYKSINKNTMNKFIDFTINCDVVSITLIGGVDLNNLKTLINIFQKTVIYIFIAIIEKISIMFIFSTYAIGSV
jgi:hypothetical protein